MRRLRGARTEMMMTSWKNCSTPWGKARRVDLTATRTVMATPVATITAPALPEGIATRARMIACRRRIRSRCLGCSMPLMAFLRLRVSLTHHCLSSSSPSYEYRCRSSPLRHHESSRQARSGTPPTWSHGRLDRVQKRQQNPSRGPLPQLLRPGRRRRRHRLPQRQSLLRLRGPRSPSPQGTRTRRSHERHRHQSQHHALEREFRVVECTAHTHYERGSRIQFVELSVELGVERYEFVEWEFAVVGVVE